MKEDVDSKLKAAAEELDGQEREMQEREAEMERASTGLGLRPGQPKLMRRWASLPSTAPPIDDIRNDGDDAEDLFGSESPTEFRRLQERRRQRQSFKGAYLRALQQSPKLTAEGKEYPFIPCTCCERKSPIPRLKTTLGQKAQEAIARYAPREAWQ
eukprot:s27_g14.t1